MHSSEEVLNKKLLNAENDIIVGGVYAHYKDTTKTYEVRLLSIAESDETPQVVYKALYGKGLTFVRSLSSWNDNIEINGRQVKRFTLVE